MPVPDREANEITWRGAVTNITVFFELLPEECFFDPAPTAGQRKELLDGKTVNGLRIGVRDIRNGYMNLTGPFEGVWEMCFWNTADKGKLVAVNARSCGPVCRARLFFYCLDVDGVLQSDPEVWSALERRRIYLRLSSEPFRRDGALEWFRSKVALNRSKDSSKSSRPKPAVEKLRHARSNPL